MAECWSCGESYEIQGKVTRDQECSRCAAWLRCCRNCTFFDEFAPNQCREPQAELQPDKEAANACDYFRPSGRGPSTKGPKSKGDFDGLFRD
jgi:hypothetical protein